MSAFIVNKRTMHHAVYALTDPLADCATRDELGRSLYALNARAVNHRYQHHGRPQSPPPYSYSPIKSTTIQLYKSLSCLWYQCGEGDVPETDLWRQMDERRDALAHEIVGQLHDYSLATWDF